MLSSVNLYQLLQAQNNNLDFFRVVAALFVIYGHAPEFIADNGAGDLVFNLLGFDYSGVLAVKFFFMLSGLLVARSFLMYPSAREFLVKRAIRIFPGLCVCIFITVFIVGSLFTHLDLLSYLAHPQTWSYFFHNSTLIVLQWSLPEVFTQGQTQVVNGSLWTLPLEVICYVCLMLFFLVVLRWPAWLASVLLLFPIGLGFFGEWILPELWLRYSESVELGGCFCIGILFALNQRAILLNWQVLVFGIFTLMLLWQSPLKQLCFYILLFYACLYCSGTQFLIRWLKLPDDPSYGIYIYGFLIQQILAALFPASSMLFNQLVSALCAICAGFLSWYLIEKPAMQYMRKRLLK